MCTHWLLWDSSFLVYEMKAWECKGKSTPVKKALSLKIPSEYTSWYFNVRLNSMFSLLVDVTELKDVFNHKRKLLSSCWYKTKPMGSIYSYAICSSDTLTQILIVTKYISIISLFEWITSSTQCLRTKAGAGVILLAFES